MFMTSHILYIQAHFRDVQILVPILNQLVGLVVYESVNAQIPDLLCTVLPEGLPNLKSLSIEHCYSRTADDQRFWNGYIHTITRVAPNLEEIAFLAGLPEFVRSLSPFGLSLLTLHRSILLLISRAFQSSNVSIPMLLRNLSFPILLRVSILLWDTGKPT